MLLLACAQCSVAPTEVGRSLFDIALQLIARFPKLVLTVAQAILGAFAGGAPRANDQRGDKECDGVGNIPNTELKLEQRLGEEEVDGQSREQHGQQPRSCAAKPCAQQDSRKKEGGSYAKALHRNRDGSGDRYR